MTLRISEVIGAGFLPLHCALRDGGCDQLVLKGGRGSGKSSFAALEGIFLLLKNPGMHGVVMRKVAATLRSSVFAQYRWAVRMLGVEDDFCFTVSPMEARYLPTGQSILFLGADDCGKLKSLKFAFGYAGYLHFEEFDQFGGEEEIRSIEQSVLRGGTGGADFAGGRLGSSGGRLDSAGGRMDSAGGRVDSAGGKVDSAGGRVDSGGGRLDSAGGRVDSGGGRVDSAGGKFEGTRKTAERIFEIKCFNPPRERNHWANLYCLREKEGQIVHHSSYLDMPHTWLGERFLRDAMHLKTCDPATYAHEYGGEANGSGGLVFGNLFEGRVTDEEIAGFERVYSGVDWGYWPDPFAFVRASYRAAGRCLVIFDEIVEHKLGNYESAALVGARVAPGELIVCDSAEPKSIADFRAYGLRAQGAEKGAGSLGYSMKWMQGLKRIQIDPVRCPVTFREFSQYAYIKGRDGEVLPGYLDRDNHCIDAVRYAMGRVWGRRGSV